MKAKINIDTLTRITAFVGICERLECRVDLIDGANYRVSAKSLMGALATRDWSEVYVECEHDIYSHIMDFLAE